MEHLDAVIKKTISKATMDIIKDIIPRIIEIAEFKAEGITVDDIVAAWNEEHPDMTMPTNVSKKPRAKTDSSRKCPFVLTRGENAGKTCGKNCVENADYCSSHNKSTTTKSDEKVADPPSSVPSGLPASASNDDTPSASAPSSAPEGCHHVLESGANKGKQCGKKITKDDQWCTAHGKKH